MRSPTPDEINKASQRLADALKTDTSAGTPAELKDFVTAAWDLIAGWLGPESVPDSVMLQAVHTVALELQRREKAPGGVLAPFGGDGGPVRLARDPLTPAIPLLRTSIKAGIG